MYYFTHKRLPFRFSNHFRESEILQQGQLLEGVECHIYLYCFTFDDINLNRVLSLLSYFQKHTAIRKCVQMIKERRMHYESIDIIFIGLF